MFEELHLFVLLVDCGGFSETAKMLGMSLATISRKITALESEIGLSLFYNDGKSVQLTNEGREVYNLINNDLHQLNHQIEGIKHIKKQLSGDLTVVLPPFMNLVMNATPKLSSFLEQYSDINLRILHYTSDISAINFQFDLAISHLIPHKTELLAQPIFENETILTASPEYINKYGKPSTLDELSNHKLCILFLQNHSPLLRWHIKDVSTDKHFIFHLKKYQLAVDVAGISKEIGLQGKGICVTPELHVRKEIRDGKLVNIFPNLSIHTGKLYSIRPNVYKTKKIEIFENFVLENLNAFEKSNS